MDIKEVLTERFIKAIKKSLPQTPLIGPKWFKLYPKGRPADFQFTGCVKVAKAACKSPTFILQAIMKNLSIDDVAAKVTTGQDFTINVTLIDKFKGGKGQ